MPPRWLCIGIVLFWLGTTGPLVWKELIAPLWRRDRPAPYSFDLMDEAQGEKGKISWQVYIGEGEPDWNQFGHMAESWVKYHDDEDTFSIHTELKASQRLGPISFGLVALRKLTSVERVTRDARLLRMRVEVEFDVPALHLERIPLVIDGKVENNAFAPVISVRHPLLPPFDFTAPTVRIPAGSSVLLPLHLVNRLRGIRPGQIWSVALMDPVKTSMNFFGGQRKAELRFIDARVLPETRLLPGPHGVLCRIIEYDTETSPRTWVQVSTDQVVRQEAVYEGTRIVIQRRNIQPDR